MMRGFILVCLLSGIVTPTSFLSKCQTNDDCEKAYNDKYICQDQKCVHEAFFPMTLWKILGVFSVIVVSAVANLGGIGGGEIIVPIYIYFFSFTIGDAIPLSKVTILSGAIISIVFTYNRRRENSPNSLMVDFKLLSFIVPTMLAGTVVGVSMTKFFPPSLILIAMVVYILILTVRTFAKATELFERENQNLGIKANRKESRSLMVLRLLKRTAFAQLFQSHPYELVSATEGSGQDEGDNLMAIEELPEDEEMQEYEENPKSFWELASVYKKNIIFCFFAFFIVFSTSILRGGKGIQSIIGIGSCSLLSWLIFGVGQIACFALILHLYFDHHKNSTKSLTFVNNMDDNFFKSIIIHSYFAGAVAGTLGMGGGIVINPMLLGFGIEPEVSAAVSSMVVFFTSMSTTTQFFIIGGIDISKVIFILICSGIGAFVATNYIDKIVHRYKRPSILVWILVSMLAFSAVTMTFIGAIRVSEEKARFSFGSPC